MTQVESYPPRRARRATTGPAPGRSVPPGTSRPAPYRPEAGRAATGPYRPEAPRAAAGPYRPEPPRAAAGPYRPDAYLTAEQIRRGSHATPHGQDFSWVMLWTILGALIPGSGLIAAGWRRLGALLLGLIGAVLVALVLLVLTGKIQALAISLAFNAKQLMILAVGAAVVGFCWVLVILLTSTQLRRYASLSSGQRLFSGLVVLALIGAVLIPAYQVGNYAMITRSVVTNNSVFAGDSDAAGGPDAGKRNPWAGKPQVNVLLIGSDAGKGRQGIRPDTLILASINTKTGKTVMFSLPRSLQRAPFPEGTGGNEAWPNGYYCPERGPGNECLINAIWRWAEEDGKQYYADSKNPGLEATEDAVEGVTGLKVDTYVMLNLNGFQDFVDALGGVTIDVKQRLPIGGSSLNKVATGGYIEKGNNQKLDGYHALWYARSRWSTTDYDRMQRQRCVIGAVVEQSDPLKVARNFSGIAAALKKNLATGISSSDLEAWATLAQQVQKGGVRSIVFDPDVINTVDPDIPAIHELVEKAVKSTTREKKAADTTPATSSPTSTPTETKAPNKPNKPVKPGTAQSIKSVC